MIFSRVIAIRPEPGCSATVKRGEQLGLPMAGFPLFEVVPVAWEQPVRAHFDGVLVGSANAFRHGGEGLEGLQHLPVYAVGEATAQAARAAGFTVAQVGAGGLQAVLDSLAGQQLALIRLAGRDHVALSPPPGIKLAERICYESRALPLPEMLVESLQGGALVLLHSAVAATHLASEVQRIGLPRGQLALACLGPRIAASAGTGWAAVVNASTPTETALLALARDMCHGKAIER
ncbi:MAG: uroporphyrinogen-III synthase [Sphingomonadaceae bacterium]|nr:uroporphyrinogen-III synthase [Sphingomonadaceae bacterium]